MAEVWSLCERGGVGERVVRAGESGRSGAMPSRGDGPAGGSAACGSRGGGKADIRRSPDPPSSIPTAIGGLLRDGSAGAAGYVNCPSHILAPPCSRKAAESTSRCRVRVS
jgi:hypothetical protein